MPAADISEAVLQVLQRQEANLQSSHEGELHIEAQAARDAFVAVMMMGET